MKKRKEKKNDELHDEQQQQQLKKGRRWKGETEAKEKQIINIGRERETKWQGGGRMERKMKDLEGIRSYRQTNMRSCNIHIF